jgi:hypothetical protein
MNIKPPNPPPTPDEWLNAFYERYPEMKPVEYLAEKSFDDTSYGSGTASVQLFAAPEWGCGVVDLTLTWRPDSTEGQPDVWEITWSHTPSMIWASLWEYLNRYCPVPEQVWQTVRTLETVRRPTGRD